MKVLKMIRKIFKSMIKGFRLSYLQRKYVKYRQDQNLDGSYLKSIVERTIKDDVLIKDYIDLCLTDPNIKEICQTYGLSSNDLYSIFCILELGLGYQYWKGHYAFMSTLAYPEPLEFTVVKLREDENVSNICKALKEYWTEEVGFGALFSTIKNSNQFIKR